MGIVPPPAGSVKARADAVAGPAAALPGTRGAAQAVAAAQAHQGRRRTVGRHPSEWEKA